MLFCALLHAERASYNGSIEASQASDVGSIPIARSITHNNLRCKHNPIHGDSGGLRDPVLRQSEQSAR